MNKIDFDDMENKKYGFNVKRCHHLKLKTVMYNNNILLQILLQNLEIVG